MYVLGWHLNELVFDNRRMSLVSEYQADGPATENKWSPSLVAVCRTLYVSISVDDHSPCRLANAAVVWTMSLMLV